MAEEKESGGTEWMQKLWRPAMGWMYMLICLLDMAVFPVLWSLLQAMMHIPITQWNPLTLQGAGLFHIAMGAVLGISAFGRTQEKLAGTAANPTATSQTMTNNTNMSGVPTGMQGGMGGMQGGGMGGGFGGSTGGFGGASNGGFGSSTGGAPAFGAPATGFRTPPQPTMPMAQTSGFQMPMQTPVAAPAAYAPPVTAMTSSGKKIIPEIEQPLL
jgi:hypothetical protein